LLGKEENQQRCEVYTRVMGYHRPVSEFNLGKQSEQERMHFNEPILAQGCVSQEQVWTNEVEYGGCSVVVVLVTIY
jgi:hypothetical protein